ncbi:MAG: hypothetical protein ACYTFY_20410 [Planctomycetota bacterium]|jgi:phosphoglycolate phosphatase-like HAD superfamily hydrolase
MTAKRIIMTDYDGVIVDSYEYFKDAFLDSCRDNDCSEIDTEEKFKNLFELNFYDGMKEYDLSEDKIDDIISGMNKLISERRHE